MSENTTETTSETVGLLAFDLETTGVDVQSDRIVTASVVRMHPNGTNHVIEWIVDPGVEIPEEAAAVHGVTTEVAREKGVSPWEALTEIAAEFQKAADNDWALAGYNLSFDLTLLFNELHRYGVPKPVFLPVLDGIVLDKRVDKFRKGGRKLEQVAEHYGVKLDNAHTADADALAAGLVVRALLASKERLQNVSVESLHKDQIRWRYDQQDSLEKFLRKKNDDPELTVDKSWPIIKEKLNG